MMLIIRIMKVRNMMRQKVVYTLMNTLKMTVPGRRLLRKPGKKAVIWYGLTARKSTNIF